MYTRRTCKPDIGFILFRGYLPLGPRQKLRDFQLTMTKKLPSRVFDNVLPPRLPYTWYTAAVKVYRAHKPSGRSEITLITTP